MSRRSPKMVRFLRRAALSTRNVLELAKFGRLGAPYAAPYEVIDEGPHHRLRRYATGADASAPAAVLIPPLMVTSEVYDLEENNSAVGTLGALGVQPYVVDFGAPERQAGGMKRTLDDHVVAAVRAVEHVQRRTGRPVHLCGYSQGGMFAYQTAAFLRSEGIASVSTFGAPVDIHKNVPAFHKDATAAFIRFVEPIVTKSIERIEGLPGIITSTGFKILSTKKEIGQRLDFLTKLHDRRALIRREARRRFLGGEGFVAWPGPAFREFVDQFIVHNRMLSGGFVLSGRTVTLADMTCPVLAFIGSHDDMARPAAVRAILSAAPNTKVSFVTVDAGHFGIVVGSRATKETWPTVAGFIHHVEGKGPLPEAIVRANAAPPPPAAIADEPEGAGFDVDVDVSFFVDALGASVKTAWARVGDVASSASDAYDAVRYQEPRLRRLANLRADSSTSASRALRDRARRDPEGTFFLWQSRAFTYRDADTRVTNIVKGLHASGVRAGDRVGVVMSSRPSFLSVVTALSRLGAVAVLPPPKTELAPLARAFAAEQVRFVAADVDHTEKARAAFDGDLLLFGGGSRARLASVRHIDMEAIDPARIELPASLPLDAGRARDLALVLLRPTESGDLRAAKVTNHRWALSAWGAAAACTIKPEDTVYCCIPLHHPAGILVGVGSALVGGARLALAEAFDPRRFLVEVRRYGATIACYAGEMLRPLIHLPPQPGDATLPLRLFAGSGIRADLARKLEERFRAGTMEFYASTGQRIIYANASGEKPGAIGRPLPGSAPTEIARLDPMTFELARTPEGRLQRASTDELGLLACRLDPEEDIEHRDQVVEGAFDERDRWYVTSDVVRRDADGDVWFVDSRSAFAHTSEGAASTRAVESALYTLPEIEIAAAWVEGDRIVAAVKSEEALDEARLAEALEALPPHARPVRVRRLPDVALTEGFRPNKRRARDAADPERA